MSGNDTRRWVAAYGAVGGAADYGNLGTDGNEATSGSSIGATGFSAYGTIDSIWVQHSSANMDTTSVLLFLSMPMKGFLEAGSPKQVSAKYTISRVSEQSSKFNIDLELHTLSKSPSKHKETGWLSFQPPFSSSTVLEMDKLGSWIDPTDILAINGSNFHMHAVNSGVRWRGSSGIGLTIETLDAAVISVGEANPVPTTAINGDPLYPGGRLTPDPSGGVHFSLFNNIVGIKLLFLLHVCFS